MQENNNRVTVLLHKIRKTHKQGSIILHYYSTELNSQPTDSHPPNVPAEHLDRSRAPQGGMPTYASLSALIALSVPVDCRTFQYVCLSILYQWLSCQCLLLTFSVYCSLSCLLLSFRLITGNIWPKVPWRTELYRAASTDESNTMRTVLKYSLASTEL